MSYGVLLFILAGLALLLLPVVLAVVGRQRQARKVAEAWRELLDRRDVLIVDTETTGLSPRSEVVEVAVLDATGNVHYQALSLPVGPIPREASDLHGLTRAILRREGARSWPEIHPELAAVLAAATAVVGWNAAFDKRLLEQTAERHGLTLPELPWRDLLEEYRRLGYKTNGLEAAVRREGVRESGTIHRCAADCRRILGVLQAVAARH